MPEFKKHIPVNSINFIFKFNSPEDVIDCLSDEDFGSAQAKLFNIATVMGAEVKMFTHPKELE